MGIWDAFTDMVEAVTPWSVVEAEAPAEETKQEETTEETKSDDAADEKPEESEEAEEDAAEEEEEEEEEEEDEDEIVDPKDVLEEECRNGPQCAPAKHHYDDCAARVQKQQDDGEEVTEDCVEEFFHLAHCATACAAPKLWSKLK